MENRRKHERFHFLASAWVKPLSQKGRIPANVTSLSRGGMGLFSEGFLEIGQEVEIDITWKGSGGQALKNQLRGKIVASQVGIEGNTLSIQFTEPLGSDHRELLDYAQKIQQG